MSALGQFANGPIQFGAGGAIESRGTIDSPQPSATQALPTPAASPSGGGVLTDFPGRDQAHAPGSVSSMGGTNSGAMPGMLSTAGFSSGSSNGGSYGMGGGGTGALPGLDAGGMVPDPSESDTSSTVDPMAMIQQAAAFGRKSMGLPTNFTDGTSDDQAQGQQSFDDGGEVQDEQGMIPDQQDDQQVTAGGNSSGGSMPDPRKAISYLAGDGAISPEVAQALEKHVDPQGTMDPAERTMAAITKAPSPAAKFGLMQHYRTKYNAYAGGAKAAMDQGNAGQAAIHATQAFANVPTGMKVKFAPTQGGMAVMANKIGGQPQQASPQPQASAQDQGQGQDQQSFEDGGEVQSDDSSDQTGSTPKSDQSDDSETFLNRADAGMRKFVGAGALGKAPLRAGDDAWEKYHGSGKISLDEGGVVPTDPQDQQEDDAADAQDDQGASFPGPTASPAPAEAPSAPVVLSKEQFKKMMSAGMDQPIDHGWDGFMSAITGAAHGAASYVKGKWDATARPTGTTPEDQADDDAADAADQSQQAPSAPAAPYAAAPGGMMNSIAQTMNGEKAKAPPSPLNPPSGPAPAKPAAPSTPDEFAKYEAAADSLQRVARRMPGTQAEREAWVQARLTAMMTHADTMETTNANNDSKADVAETRGFLKATQQTAHDQSVADRAKSAWDARTGINATNNDQKASALQVKWVSDQVRNLRNNKPNVTPDEIQKQLAPLMQQYGINPNALHQALGGGQAPAAAPVQQQKTVIFKGGPFAGKPVIKQPDGSYILAPGQ